MIFHKEACDIIAKEAGFIRLKECKVELPGSLGHVLAEDVYADISFPNFHNSAMDGIAVMFNSAIREWKITGSVPAGKFRSINYNENETVMIMTGGMLPECANTVIPLENLIIEENVCRLKEHILIKNGEYVRLKGEDVNRGTKVMSKGKKISAKEIAVLASCGKSEVSVYAPLKIGVFTTGDELVDINEIPLNDKVRASNLYSLLAVIKEAGMVPVNFGIVRDNKDELFGKVKIALNSDIDILITTGGVSVGEYDYLNEVMKNAGILTKFWRVNIKPGKPISFGTYSLNDKVKLVFGLPGNPVSSFVGFRLFVQTALNTIYHQEPEALIYAVLKQDIVKDEERKYFVRGKYTVNNESNGYTVECIGRQSSGDLAALSNSNCLIILDEGIRDYKKGESVKCMRI
jgi:molybdopterin molybdotransferase